MLLNRKSVYFPGPVGVHRKVYACWAGPARRGLGNSLWSADSWRRWDVGNEMRALLLFGLVWNVSHKINPVGEYNNLSAFETLFQLLYHHG
jgi:hypothetical protein